ncbi:hypothetical protein SCG7086_CY_00010, partial [Chlamydiales bacterium SCGC AG-110-P3]
ANLTQNLLSDFDGKVGIGELTEEQNNSINSLDIRDAIATAKNFISESGPLLTEENQVNLAEALTTNESGSTTASSTKAFESWLDKQPTNLQMTMKSLGKLLDQLAQDENATPESVADDFGPSICKMLGIFSSDTQQEGIASGQQKAFALGMTQYYRTPEAARKLPVELYNKILLAATDQSRQSSSAPFNPSTSSISQIEEVIKNLATLDLSDMEPTPENLSDLAILCPNAISLSLPPEINDEHMTAVANFNNLARLELSKKGPNSITDSGLKELSGMTQLEELHLANCQHIDISKLETSTVQTLNLKLMTINLVHVPKIKLQNRHGRIRHVADAVLARLKHPKEALVADEISTEQLFVDSKVKTEEKTLLKDLIGGIDTMYIYGSLSEGETQGLGFLSKEQVRTIEMTNIGHLTTTIKQFISESGPLLTEESQVNLAKALTTNESGSTTVPSAKAFKSWLDKQPTILQTTMKSLGKLLDQLAQDEDATPESVADDFGPSICKMLGIFPSDTQQEGIASGQQKAFALGMTRYYRTPEAARKLPVELYDKILLAATDQSRQSSSVPFDPSTSSIFQIEEVIKNLATLDLSAMELTPENLSDLAILCPNAISLSLPSGINDAHMTAVANFNNLARLELSKKGPNSITDGGLKELSGMTQLEELHLPNCQEVTEKGVNHMKNLRRLSLSACPSVKLSELDTSNLRTLDLTNMPLNSFPADMANMTQLIISNTKISNITDHLRKHPGFSPDSGSPPLIILFIGCGLSQPAQESIQEANPQLQIEFYKTSPTDTPKEEGFAATPKKQKFSDMNIWQTATHEQTASPLPWQRSFEVISPESARTKLLDQIASSSLEATLGDAAINNLKIMTEQALETPPSSLPRSWTNMWVAAASDAFYDLSIDQRKEIDPDGVISNEFSGLTRLITGHPAKQTTKKVSVSIPQEKEDSRGDEFKQGRAEQLIKTCRKKIKSAENLDPLLKQIPIGTQQFNYLPDRKILNFIVFLFNNAANLSVDKTAIETPAEKLANVLKDSG